MKTAMACLLATALTLPGAGSAASKLPADVANYVDKRDECDYFRSEPGEGDKARQKEIDRELKRLCKGTDQALAGLKKKYAGDRLVLKKLNEYDPGIEAK